MTLLASEAQVHSGRAPLILNSLGLPLSWPVLQIGSKNLSKGRRRVAGWVALAKALIERKKARHLSKGRFANPLARRMTDVRPRPMTVCAIHQPNFFPWLGFFDKIHRADVFVLLDDVDYPRAGSGGMGSWTNRVKVNVQGQAKWVGCPIDKASSGGAIQQVRISPDPHWKRKLIRTLAMNYKRASRFNDAMTLLEPIIDCDLELISDYNINAIEKVSDALAINTKLVRQSSLGTQQSSTDLLIEICRHVGAGAYLAGGGAGGYQEDEKFSEAGLDLVEQNFAPFKYGDETDFIAGLSVIDFLMHAEDWSYEEASRRGRV
ncbi:MAG: WbqC family protein [Pseudomonadota bacterium]